MNPWYIRWLNLRTEWAMFMSFQCSHTNNTLWYGWELWCSESRARWELMNLVSPLVSTVFFGTFLQFQPRWSIFNLLVYIEDFFAYDREDWIYNNGTFCWKRNVFRVGSKVPSFLVLVELIKFASFCLCEPGRRKRFEDCSAHYGPNHGLIFWLEHLKNL